MSEWLSWFPWWFQDPNSGWAVIAILSYLAELVAFVASMVELSNPYGPRWARPAIVWPLVFLGVLTLPIAPYIGMSALAGGALWLVANAFGTWAKDTKKLVEEVKVNRLAHQSAKVAQRSLSPARMNGSVDDKALSLTEGA